MSFPGNFSPFENTYPLLFSNQDFQSSYKLDDMDFALSATFPEEEFDHMDGNSKKTSPSFNVNQIKAIQQETPFFFNTPSNVNFIKTPGNLLRIENLERDSKFKDNKIMELQIQAVNHMGRIGELEDQATNNINRIGELENLHTNNINKIQGLEIEAASQLIKIKKLEDKDLENTSRIRLMTAKMERYKLNLKSLEYQMNRLKEENNDLNNQYAMSRQFYEERIGPMPIFHSK